MGKGGRLAIQKHGRATEIQLLDDWQHLFKVCFKLFVTLNLFSAQLTGLILIFEFDEIVRHQVVPIEREIR